jgi:hypothetical protein
MGNWMGNFAVRAASIERAELARWRGEERLVTHVSRGMVAVVEG